MNWPPVKYIVNKTSTYYLEQNLEYNNYFS